jgi:hypothetical protein
MDELMDDMETEVLPVQCHETCSSFEQYR